MPDITDHDGALAYLDAHIGRGVKPGLDRIRGLLDVLAGPQDGYPVIHVAGTNGKTSTSRLTAAILRAHGLTTGLFTSPHLERVEERYEVSGEIMTADQFVEAVAGLEPFVTFLEERSGDPITYFELTTALAFTWFSERTVDVAVIETGLGGRLDATNVVDAEVAVVTTIGLEHQEYLGDTIAEIAGEKLAILGNDRTLVTGVLPEEAMAVAARRVEETGSRWLQVDRDVRATEVTQAFGGWVVDIAGAEGDYDEVNLGVHGRHQVDNLLTAVAAIEGLFGRSLDLGALREAAATVRLPGRMELVHRDPPLMLDGAHNPHGAETLGGALAREFPSTSWEVVIGVMADKDVVNVLEGLRGRVTSIRATAARESERAMPPDRLAALAAEVLGVPATAHPSVAEALKVARGSGGPVLVTGSLYLVGEARSALDLRSGPGRRSIT
ncbi:MAG TPA: folylpolyglutamate synthase/dihydrofolate synthase family protein [Acidimicrobiia bacterium]|nr:folylpolyglutamate synthase/dihydrofolate synthase family protein [Acidimicrobiia bacterium]